ncbi:MAG: hypothetical protein ACOC1L_03590 [Bacillota bacterium]
MKINVLPIVSALHKGDIINNETRALLTDIESISDFSFNITDKSSLYATKLSLILVQSGGSEGRFLEIEKALKPPFYLLTYGSNNSLAASMEILSYLKGKNACAEILHGSPKYIAKRLQELVSKKESVPIKLGVIGKPSDWLIASNVDYNHVKKAFNIDLIDIGMGELINTYNAIDLNDYKTDLDLDFNNEAVKDAKKLSKALMLIKDKYELKGLTLRCFDLLDTIKTTGCLGLALLNKEDSIGTCEGDIPSMLSMVILKQVTNQPGFQANPSKIDTEKHEMVFAHCTLPLDMADSYDVMTHYESGIGVALRGHLKKAPITVFKLSNNLKDYYVSEGNIIRNLEEANLCRTQIRVSIDNTDYFLKKPYGNHHIIVYGHHKEAIKHYLDNL